jgi:hypothetical protein
MPTADRRMWRRVLAADLGLFNAAIFLFALLPPTTLLPQEWLAMTLSGLAMVGVVAHACHRIHLPGEGYAYLATAMVGAYVFAVYAHAAEAPASVKVPFLLFLASGIASGLAAHVIDGGPGNG